MKSQKIMIKQLRYAQEQYSNPAGPTLRQLAEELEVTNSLLGYHLRENFTWAEWRRLTAARCSRQARKNWKAIKQRLEASGV